MEITAFSSLLTASAITTKGTMTRSSTPALSQRSAMGLSLPTSPCKGCSWLGDHRADCRIYLESRLVGFYLEIGTTLALRAKRSVLLTCLRSMLSPAPSRSQMNPSLHRQPILL